MKSRFTGLTAMVVFVALFGLALIPPAAKADEAPAQRWVLLSISQSVTGGEEMKIELADGPMGSVECVNALAAKGHPQVVKDLVATTYVCRQIDENNQPVAEDKVDPNGKPLPKEAPPKRKSSQTEA